MAEGPLQSEGLDPMDVFEKIKRVQNKSLELCIKLGVEKYAIESLHDTYRDPSERLLQVLYKCDERKPLTWERIVIALGSPALEAFSLAEKLRRNYCPDMKGLLFSDSQADDAVQPINDVADVKARIEHFNERFEYLKECTREHFETEEVPVRKVAEGLTSMSCDAADVHILFLEENFDKLFDAENHSKFFGRMNFHWNYLTYHPLDHLAKRFNIQHVKEEMELYKSDLQVFRKKTPLTLFCKAQEKKCLKPLTKFKKLVARFDWPESVTLEVADEFRKKYAYRYHLWECAMMLEEVRPGSFVVTWLIPESIVGVLRENIPTDLLENYYVHELLVDGISVYKQKSKGSDVALSSGYSSYSGIPTTVSSERRQPGTCIQFKLLGECANQPCYFKHDFQEERTAESTIELPQGITYRNATRGNIVRQLRNNVLFEFCFRQADKNSVSIVVSYKNAHFLKKLEDEYRLLLPGVYSRGMGYCYIHKDGLAECSMLEFKQYESAAPKGPGEPRTYNKQGLFELCIHRPVEDSGAASKAGPHKATEIVKDGDKIMLVEDHLDHINETLKLSLEKLCAERKEGVAVRFEGRFGKVVWRGVPRDPFTVDEFWRFCESGENCSRRYSPGLIPGSVEKLRQMFHQERRHGLIETYDIKFTQLQENKELDLQLKFNKGRPEVVCVVKNNSSMAVFDVLNLHRNHDLRMSLGQYELAQKGSREYSVAEGLLKTVSLSELDETITLVPRTDSWCVNFIRHKKRETYLFQEKYFVTLTEAAEYRINKGHQVRPELKIYPDYYDRRCTELELHHCSWECAFGRSAGLSPEQSLAVLIDSPSVDPEVAVAIPHPWQPEHILQDLQEFWRNLETLNDAMGPFP